MVQDVHQKIIIYYNYEGSLRKILICFYYEPRNHIKSVQINLGLETFKRVKVCLLEGSKAFILYCNSKMISG